MKSQPQTSTGAFVRGPAALLRSPLVLIGGLSGMLATGLVAFALTQSAASASERVATDGVKAETAQMRMRTEQLTRAVDERRAESARYDADIRDAEAARASADAAAARRVRQASERSVVGAKAGPRRDNAEQFIRTLLQESDKPAYNLIGRDLFELTSREYVDLFPQDPIASLDAACAGVATSMGLSERALLHVERERTANAAAATAAPDGAEVAAATQQGDLAARQGTTKSPPTTATDPDTKAAGQEFQSLRKLAIAQHRDGKLDEAMATCRKALDLLPKMNQKTRPPTESDLLGLMGRWQRDAGNLREALVLAHEAFSVQRAATTKVEAYAAKANEVARLHLALGDAEPALTLLDPLMAELTADEKPDSDGDMLDALILKAHASRLLGKADEEAKAYERILGAYWYETQRYGVFENQDWVNYLIARGEVERAELTLWAILRRRFQIGSKVNFAAQVERLASLPEGKADKKRAEIYRRSADRLKKLAQTKGDAADEPDEK